jgi:hypothetical protein
MHFVENLSTAPDRFVLLLRPRKTKDATRAIRKSHSQKLTPISHQELDERFSKGSFDALNCTHRFLTWPEIQQERFSFVHLFQRQTRIVCGVELEMS